MPVEELAPAKINLDLHVTGRRADGYHDLDSLTAFTAFGDRLALQEHDRLELELRGPFAGPLAAEPDNRFNLQAVAVMVSGEKIGYLPPEISRHYFGALKDKGAECPGRRAPMSSHENTGTDVLLDRSGVPCEPCAVSAY